MVWLKLVFYLRRQGRIPETKCASRNKIIWVLTALCHTAAIVIKCEPGLDEWTLGWCESANRWTLEVSPQIDLEALLRLLEVTAGVTDITMSRPHVRDIRPPGHFKELLSGPMLPEALLRIYRVTTN